MQRPLKIRWDIGVGVATGLGVDLSKGTVFGIKFPSSMTGATLTIQGVAVPIDSGTFRAPASAEYENVVDNAGATVTITVHAGKVQILTDDQVKALRCCHWVRLVSDQNEAAGRLGYWIGATGAGP